MHSIAIGFIETDSVAAGIEAADAVVKRASVDLLEARPMCPGKHMILFSGDTSQVHSALAAGLQIAGSSLVDSLFLPNVHPAVFSALDLSSSSTNGTALGIIETVTAAVCIVAADAAVKAADINLIELRLANGLGGKSFVLFEGEVDAVAAALAAGAEGPTEAGLLVRKTIIPSLAPQVRSKIL